MKSTAYLNDLGLISALGRGRAEVAERLFRGESPGLRATERWSPGRELYLGQVEDPLPDLVDRPLRHRSRNNRLLAAALEQIRPQVDALMARYGADRVAVVIGTSTSGVAEAEQAFRREAEEGHLGDAFHFGQQEMGSPAAFLASELGVRGPAWAISTACTSSAKALATAARLLDSGQIDAVVAGGADSLCAYTVAGFTALDSVSESRCNPLSANRRGINIGEAAVLFTVTREPGPVALLGWGESSDGHHMSAPDPDGSGARLAIRQALERARLPADAIDYINLHGTATPLNDAMEARVVADLFGTGVPVSSTKSLTGHVLGAAGALEAAIAWLTLHPDNADGRLPPQVWDGVPDPDLPALKVVAAGERLERRPRAVLSSSFAFGGNNAVLVLGAAPC